MEQVPCLFFFYVNLLRTRPTVQHLWHAAFWNNGFLCICCSFIAKVFSFLKTKKDKPLLIWCNQMRQQTVSVHTAWFIIWSACKVLFTLWIKALEILLIYLFKTKSISVINTASCTTRLVSYFVQSCCSLGEMFVFRLWCVSRLISVITSGFLDVYKIIHESSKYHESMLKGFAAWSHAQVHQVYCILKGNSFELVTSLGLYFHVCTAEIWAALHPLRSTCTSGDMPYVQIYSLAACQCELSLY